MSTASSRSSELPELSVVVPSVNGWEYLAPTLEALDGDRGDIRIEVLVPDRCGERVRREIERAFPDVRVLAADPGTPIPRMRALACAEARAESIAIIEDHVIVPPGWAGRMVAVRRRGERAAAGRVVNGAATRLVDRVAFLCEYHALIGPLPSGPVEWLPGNNTVYARDVLIPELSRIGARWEDDLHRALRASGVVLHMHPEIAATHRMHYTIGEYTVQRFLYSRAFVAMRDAGRGLGLRALRAAATVVALPPVLLWRIARRGWSDPEWRTTMRAGAPLLLLFVVSWALGEAVGSIAGDGGALGRVR